MAKHQRDMLPWTSKELLTRGPRQTYTDERLSELAFPLGGIGTGTVSLGGCGELRDWEFFNEPNKDNPAGINFFTLWTQAKGCKAVVKVLQTHSDRRRTGPHGDIYTRMMGLPRMQSLEFTGEYPLARVNFHDRDLPVRVELEAYTPFIPLDADDSGLPVAVFLFTLRNTTGRIVDCTLAANFTNLVGWDGSSEVTRTGHPSLGKNLTRLVKRRGLSSLSMTSGKYKRSDVGFGSIAVATTWPRIASLAPWPRGAWFDAMHRWWDDFATDGRFKDSTDTSPSKDGHTDASTLGLRVTLKPRGTVTLPILYAWHFPNRLTVNPWRCSPERPKVRNHYAKRFSNALDVADYVARNFERLDDGTRRYHKAFFSSTLPASVMDAVSSQVSTIRTNTCLRTDNGAFHAYEGCSARSGCCPMNCTHVWNYEQTLAFLFPSLERTMRETDFLRNTRDTGNMAFRTSLPTSTPLWDHLPAADGQMGCVLKLYREWKLCGDVSWLRKLWPHAKQALEFAWKEWDRDRDGVMEAIQHNTYDIEFLGPNAMMGTLYLAALRAGARMAETLGETVSAAEYRKVAAKGAKKLDRMLFNNEFYVQKYDPKKAPKYQFGKGCLSDQLLGQWFAMVIGLGHLLDPAHVRKTLQAIFAYNWRASLADHANVQRVYAQGEESGLLLCTWPRGGRPAIPFPYSDEVWTGIEYQVAAHMLYEGMIEEGLAVVAGARERHDGRTRNPWNEPECGDHYARAMSSWSLLTALSGFQCSVPDGFLGFAPKVFEPDFRCFFSGGVAWGSYSQRLRGKRLDATVAIEGGELTLTEIEVPCPGGTSLVRASLASTRIPAELDAKGGMARIALASPIRLVAGKTLRIALT